jgi:hypothetical protein
MDLEIVKTQPQYLKPLAKICFEEFGAVKVRTLMKEVLNYAQKKRILAP